MSEEKEKSLVESLRFVEEGLGRGVIRKGASLVVASAASEIERLEGQAKELHDDAAASWECLEMVRESRLTPFLGEEEAKGVAPMFFPEAIRNVMFRAQRGDYLPKTNTPETPQHLQLRIRRRIFGCRTRGSQEVNG